MDSASAQGASPLSLTAPLAVAPSSETDSGQPSSSRSTPPRPSHNDLTRSRSTGRGGCWYVALRFLSSISHEANSIVACAGHAEYAERYGSMCALLHRLGCLLCLFRNVTRSVSMAIRARPVAG